MAMYKIVRMDTIAHEYAPIEAGSEREAERIIAGLNAMYGVPAIEHEPIKSKLIDRNYEAELVNVKDVTS